MLQKVHEKCYKCDTTLYYALHPLDYSAIMFPYLYTLLPGETSVFFAKNPSSLRTFISTAVNFTVHMYFSHATNP